MQRRHRRKQKKAAWVRRLREVGSFIISIMCLFIVVIQAMGRVVALGVATYGYVAG